MSDLAGQLSAEKLLRVEVCGLVLVGSKASTRRSLLRPPETPRECFTAKGRITGPSPFKGSRKIIKVGHREDPMSSA